MKTSTWQCTLYLGMAAVMGAAGVRAAVLHGQAAASNPGLFQTSFEPGEPMPLPAPPHGVFAAQVAGGPARAFALDAKPDVGFTGLHSLHYHGTAAGDQQQRLFDVDLPVQADTQLSYVIFPQRVEGDLRKDVQMHIKRLIDIQSYRGTRHRRGLPVHGQRTHTNARTRKGPRKGTVAGKKKATAKT